MSVIWRGGYELLNRTLLPTESDADSAARVPLLWTGMAQCLLIASLPVSEHLGRELLTIDASVFQSLAIPVSLLMGERFQINWS